MRPVSTFLIMLLSNSRIATPKTRLGKAQELASREIEKNGILNITIIYFCKRYLNLKTFYSNSGIIMNRY